MLIALRCWQRATLVTVSQNPPGRVSAGRILDPNTSRSQILGGTAFGTGMALMEQTYYDPRSGSPANSTLGDYLLPTCAVMPQSDTSSIAHPDFAFNLLASAASVRSEITGVAGTIANAAHHATHTRLRSLPITLDKFLA